LILTVQQLASHGLFDVHVKATGDTHIDDHHTNEDVALAIGTVLKTTTMLTVYFPDLKLKTSFIFLYQDVTL
jgi:hypothetical protein